MDKQKPNSECPLCGKKNQCAIAAGQTAATCWCMTTEIHPAPRRRAEQLEATRSCLCPACGSNNPAAATTRGD